MRILTNYSRPRFYFIVLCVLFGTPEFAQTNREVLSYSKEQEHVVDHEIKESYSKKYDHDKIIPNYLGVEGVYRIIGPRKQGFLTKNKLKGRLIDVNEYVNTFYPNHIYIKHQVADRKCQYITIIAKGKWDSLSVKSFASPLRGMKLLTNPAFDNHPRLPEIYKELLSLIVDEDDKYEAVKYAPDKITRDLACLHYLRCFEDIPTVKKRGRFLPRDVEDPSSIVCIRIVELVGLNKWDKTIFESDCDINEILENLVSMIPRSQLMAMKNIIPLEYQDLYLELAECEIANSIRTISEFRLFDSIYKKQSICRADALQGVTGHLKGTEKIWSFVAGNKSTINEHKFIVKLDLKLSRKSIDHLMAYHKIYHDEVSLIESAEWAISNIDIEEFTVLVESNIFGPIREEIGDMIFSRTEYDLGLCDLYLKHFSKDSDQLKEVFINSINLDSTEIGRNKKVAKFLKRFGENGLDRINPEYVDCDLIFYVANTDPKLAEGLYSNAIGCVVDFSSLRTFSEVPGYENQVEAFNKVKSELSVADLQKLYSSNHGLRNELEIEYVDKVSTPEEADWYLEHYHGEDSYRRSVSKKGLVAEFERSGKGGSTANRALDHMLQFEVDPALIKNYVLCKDVPVVLKKLTSSEDVEGLYGSISSCITSDNIDFYREYFKNLPDFQDRLMSSVLDDLSAVSTFQISIPKLNRNEFYHDSISFSGARNPVLILNIKGKLDKKTGYRIYTNEGSSSMQFTSNNKVIFLGGLKEPSVMFKAVNGAELGEVASFDKSLGELILLDVPASLRSFTHIVNNSELRKYYYRLAKRISDGDANSAEYRKMIGDNLGVLLNSKSLEKEQVRYYASKVSEFYLELVRPYYKRDEIDRIGDGIARVIKGITEWYKD